MKRLASFIAGVFLLLTGAGNAQTTLQGTWATQASEYGANTGKRYTYNFPPGVIITGRVWGSGIYTTDCSIASAAVHAGLISAQNGGTVTIEILPGQSSYEGSVYNGVTSHNWGYFGSSFVFVNERRLPGRSAPPMLYGNWTTQAAEYTGNIGQRYSFYFPPGITITGQVWGTDIYTTDCSIASAAIHAGVLSQQNGGIVTIEILAGQRSYKGSSRNGVISRDWASYGGSFRFVRRGRR